MLLGKMWLHLDKKNNYILKKQPESQSVSVEDPGKAIAELFLKVLYQNYVKNDIEPDYFVLTFPNEELRLNFEYVPAFKTQYYSKAPDWVLNVHPYVEKFPK